MLQSEVLGSPRGLNECDFYHLLRSHWTSKGGKTPFQVPHDPQKYWALDLATQPGRTDVTEKVLHPQPWKPPQSFCPGTDGGTGHKEKFRTGAYHMIVLHGFRGD